MEEILTKSDLSNTVIPLYLLQRCLRFILLTFLVQYWDLFLTGSILVDTHNSPLSLYYKQSFATSRESAIQRRGGQITQVQIKSLP